MKGLVDLGRRMLAPFRGKADHPVADRASDDDEVQVVLPPMTAARSQSGATSELRQGSSTVLWETKDDRRVEERWRRSSAPERAQARGCDSGFLGPLADQTIEGTIANIRRTERQSLSSQDIGSAYDRREGRSKGLDGANLSRRRVDDIVEEGRRERLPPTSLDRAIPLGAVSSEVISDQRAITKSMEVVVLDESDDECEQGPSPPQVPLKKRRIQKKGDWKSIPVRVVKPFESEPAGQRPPVESFSASGPPSAAVTLGGCDSLLKWIAPEPPPFSGCWDSPSSGDGWFNPEHAIGGMERDEEEEDLMRPSKRRRSAPAVVASRPSHGKAAVKRSSGAGRKEEVQEIVVLDDDEAAADDIGPSSAAARGGKSQGKTAGEGPELMVISGDEGEGDASADEGLSEGDRNDIVEFESCLTYLLHESETVGREFLNDRSKKPVQYQFSASQLRDLIMRVLSDDILHDETLNRALEMLAKTNQGRNLLIFNTFWYEKIRDGMFAEARQWMVKALGDRSLKDIAILCAPINVSNAHWVLVVADLHLGRVEVWDPSGCDYDEYKRNVKKFLDNEFKSERIKLTLGRAPDKLPMQKDVINCGLFVVLYVVHLCFIAVSGDGEKASSAMAPIFNKRERPPCKFSTTTKSLYRYRLQLLRWILNSQTTLMGLVDGVVLKYLHAKRKELKLTSVDMKPLLMSLVQDTDKKRLAVDVAMLYLNDYVSRDSIVLLGTKWFEMVKKGKAEEAAEALELEEMPKWVCAAVDVDNTGRRLVLVRWRLGDVTPEFEVYGADSLSEFDESRDFLNGFLTTIGMSNAEQRIHLLMNMPTPAHESIALIELAMRMCEQPDSRDNKPVYPDYSEPDKLFATSVAILRWLLKGLTHS